MRHSGRTALMLKFRDYDRYVFSLFDALGTTASDLSTDEVRARGRRLGSAIRCHHVLEADLVLLVFDQDTDTAD